MNIFIYTYILCMCIVVEVEEARACVYMHEMYVCPKIYAYIRKYNDKYVYFCGSGRGQCLRVHTWNVYV